MTELFGGASVETQGTSITGEQFIAAFQDVINLEDVATGFGQQHYEARRQVENLVAAEDWVNPGLERLDNAAAQAIALKSLEVFRLEFHCIKSRREVSETYRVIRHMSEGRPATVKQLVDGDSAIVQERSSDRRVSSRHLRLPQVTGIIWNVNPGTNSLAVYPGRRLLSDRPSYEVSVIKPGTREPRVSIDFLDALT